MNEKLNSDLEHILQHTTGLWEDVKDKTIFLTGGTGFFGTWLQLSFIYVNRKCKLNANMIILTRSKGAFAKKHPALAGHDEISFIEGDISTFEFPENNIDLIIHAATDASIKLNAEVPLTMFETVVNGTKRILELADIKKVKAVLFTSSGAVYGAQPPGIEKINEAYIGGPAISDVASMYAEGKRMAEILCAVYHDQKNIPVKIARCFAFIGPYLPQDAHFAAGNFIHDAIEDKEISIRGDGSPYRSYLYAADLVIWLWTILLRGRDNYPYNVGSDQQVTIEELANRVAAQAAPAKIKVNIATPKGISVSARYVPDVDRAKNELGLRVNVDLDTAIKKTLDFYRQK